MIIYNQIIHYFSIQNESSLGLCSNAFEMKIHKIMHARFNYDVIVIPTQSIQLALLSSYNWKTLCMLLAGFNYSDTK